MTKTKTTSGNPAERWKTSLVPATATIADVIRNLDASTLQIALVVSSGETLIGTVTDGDIRRGLLRGLDLNSPVDAIVHREPLVVPPQWSHEMVLELMKANKIHQLPVVDESRRVVGLHIWDDLLVPGQRPNLMVVMAGGQGARLRPHTDNCPKPLLPVGGKPMLEHIIERAKSNGFTKFTIAVHHLGHMIEEYFGTGKKWGVEIDYLREKAPLGTAGALSLLSPRPKDSFLVSNGDVLTDIQYSELLDFHRRHGAAATMAVRTHEWQHPFGVVKTNGVDLVGFEEKPVARSHINAGIYVLEPGALDVLAAGEPCDMPTLFSRIKQKNLRTIVYPMHEPWLDVGQADDLNQAQNQHSARHNKPGDAN